MTKKNFITFVNNGYMSTERIFKEAQESGFFDTISIKNEYDIREFIEKHKDFIINNKPGYGRWIWKPKIILDTLESIDEGDFLIYTDAGSYINKHGRQRFEEYLSLLDDDKPFGVFSTSPKYSVKQYVKRDAIMHYYPEFDVQENFTYQYAGIMIIKKNIFSLKVIKEWKNLCENYSYLDTSKSKKFKERKFYCGNDSDAGLFSLCIVKHKNKVRFLGENEIMIYKNGIQYHHLTKEEQEELDWNVLHDKPFQARRLTPKLYKDIV
jgi:hypothetical protein